MNEVINSCLTALNSIGRGFCDYTAGIFVQSSVLIVLLLIVDFLLRKRVRAVFRYCVWMLVFVKLILPPTLSLPTGIGYWYGDYLSTDSPVLQQVSNVVRPEHAGASAPEDFALAAEMPQDQPSQINPQIAAPVTSGVSGLNALTWQAVVFLLWLVGVFVISVLLVQRMSFVKGLIAQSEPAKNRLLDMLNQCRRKVGIRRNMDTYDSNRRIELRLTNNISSPAVCGLFKPVILIPTALLEKLSPDKLRAVLIHELVHIKRADIWVNLVQTVLQIIYFYNPFVWLANAVVRRIREQAVDEMVLVALGAGAKHYSNTLIDIAEMAFWKTSLSLRLIGVVESKKALHRRIKHMLNRPIPQNAKLGILGLIAVVVAGAMLLPMAAAAKDDTERRAKFIATLPDGVTVELVGVTNHYIQSERPAEQTWWNPSGGILQKMPYAKLGWSATTDYRNSNYEFAIRLNGKTNYTYAAGTSLNRSLGFPKIPKTKNDEFLPGISAFVGEFRKEDKLGDIRFGVALDQWEKVDEWDKQLWAVGEPDNVNITSGKSVILIWPRQKGNAVVSEVIHTFREEATRLLLIDKNDNIHETGHSIVGEASGLERNVYYFWNIKRKDIKKFEFQKRTYDWVIFRNISLRPGLKTDVQVEDNESLPSQFVATLPNGVTVELLGICEYPSEGRKWWKPDGTELSKEVRVRRMRGGVSASGIPYTVAVKVTMPEDATFELGRIKGATGGATLDAVDSEGQLIGNMQASMVYIDEQLTATSFQFGVASGAWKTKARDSSRGGKSTAGIVFSKAYESDGGVRIIVADEHLDLDYRIIAIDTQGKEHIFQQRGGSAGKVRQTTALFHDIKLNQIEYFLFQTRPYQWVEFKNVSLRPGVITYMQIEVEKSDVLRVPSDKYPTIQSAVNAAKDSDTIVVKSDVYEQNKVQITLRASVFSVRTPPSSITNFLYNELGLKNTPIVNLTDAQAEQFKKWMASIPNTTTVTSPTAIVFDRQPADLSVTTQHEYTVGYEESADSPAEYKPKRRKFTTGVELNFTPELKQDKNLIILTLNVKKTDIVKLKSKLHPSGNQIQIPVIQTAETHTTVAVPKGKYLLAILSGMSSMGNSNQPDKPVQQTILLVKAEVQLEVEGGAGKQLSSGGGYQNLSREQRERLERLRANRQSLSYKNMQKLGLAVAVFANDHNGRCPSNLSDLRRYIGDEQIFDWINRNVVYLDKNREYMAPPDAVLAYDESMLKKPRQETNVLYNDAHVALESSKWLKEIGIRLER